MGSIYVLSIWPMRNREHCSMPIIYPNIIRLCNRILHCSESSDHRKSFLAHQHDFRHDLPHEPGQVRNSCKAYVVQIEKLPQSCRPRYVNWCSPCKQPIERQKTTSTYGCFSKVTSVAHGLFHLNNPGSDRIRVIREPGIQFSYFSTLLALCFASVCRLQNEMREHTKQTLLFQNWPARSTCVHKFEGPWTATNRYHAWMLHRLLT